MSTRTILTTLLAAALTMPALAQEASTAAPASPATPAAPTETAAGTASRDKDTLSVDFPDEDIKTILRNVADLFELNLVVPDTLTGKASIKLRDVTWEQIFQVVLSPVGYSYVKDGNIIKIVSNELLQQEPGSTEVFILNNAKAGDIKPTIDGLIDAAAGGKIVIDGRSNALVITEKPSRMQRIRTIIEQLDKATDQVMIESKFVEVTDRDVRNIGINWASLQGWQLRASNINQDWKRSREQHTNDGVTSSADSSSGSNAGSTNGNNSGTTSNSSVGNTSNYVTGLADPSTGVATTFNPNTGTVGGLPNSIPTITTNANYQPGTPAVPAVAGTTGVPGIPGTPATPASADALATFNGSNTNTTNATTSNTLTNTLTNAANSAVSQLMGLTNAGTQSRMANAVFSASDFSVILSALKTQNNTKIVSNPTIVTLNNTEAFLNIGQEFPIPSYTYNSERGSFEVSGFSYKPIGIILKVTPQVNAQGVIKLTLEPEVSQQNGSTSFGGAGGASIPIIATRRAKTQVSLKDGYTMGIGGLITSSQDHGGTKVPVLGSIPGLGRLFSSKNVNDAVTNLLIFITAKTVTADGASPEEVFDPRAVRAVDMSRDDLPGYRVPKGTDMFSRPTQTK
ncbi:MAG TPA: secretin N-terminal domain-containing protein [Lacunisphaera sp.]|nr:secretin N-terminal domain-containing protein [Lacunisphaera sp.]